MELRRQATAHHQIVAVIVRNVLRTDGKLSASFSSIETANDGIVSLGSDSVNVPSVLSAQRAVLWLAQVLAIRVARKRKASGVIEALDVRLAGDPCSSTVRSSAQSSLPSLCVNGCGRRSQRWIHRTRKSAGKWLLRDLQRANCATLGEAGYASTNATHPISSEAACRSRHCGQLSQKPTTGLPATVIRIPAHAYRGVERRCPVDRDTSTDLLNTNSLG